MEFSGERMKTILGIAMVSVLCSTPLAQGQTSASGAAQAQPAVKPAASPATNQSSRADAFYYFSIAHLDEQQFEMTGRGDLAIESIEYYKKALNLAPHSSVIMERLAEVYAKSQRTREAIQQATEALKADPDNLAAHRLLARIYVRTLGDMSPGDLQKENLEKAAEQFHAILKLDPKDTSSALWLARLYRFENQHAEAEKILRSIWNAMRITVRHSSN